MPRTARRLAAFLLAGATLMSLAACAPGGREPMPSPTAAQTDEPIFASDEEALAAAVAAYEAYLDTEQRITQSDDTDSELIRAVTTTEYADELIEQYDSIRQSSLRLEGRGKLDSARLAEHSSDGSVTFVSIYACSDVSGVRVIDQSGSDVTPQRADRVPVLIEFERQGDELLLVAGSDKWPGEDFC